VEQSLSELISISHAFGSDIRLVWSGGGNVSVKTGDGSMLIKASGTELGQMTSSKGWRKVNVEKVCRLLDDLLKSDPCPERIKKGLLKVCCDKFAIAPMPSIETFFHALLGRCVIHLHPMILLPYLCSKTGQRRLREILSPEFDFHWIAFRGLGVVTAEQIRERINKKKLNLSRANIFFLSNHGLIVSCDSVKEAKKVVRRILNICRRNLPPVKLLHLSIKNRTTEIASRIQSVYEQCYDSNTNRITIPARPLYTVQGVSPAKEWFDGVITPEELTYLGAGIVWLENPESGTIQKAILTHFRKTNLWPKAFFVPRQGLFVSEKKQNLPLYRKVFAYYLQIRSQAVHLGGLKPLSRKYMLGEGL
jgi:rhamnose utilization protein RhaD (predicted bifunctional aldolase and dehydrogenase)